MPKGDRFQIEIEGVDELMASLDRIKQAAVRAAVRGIGLIQLDEVSEARKIVPKLTGYLESQIVNLPILIRALNGKVEIEGIVAAQTPYAHYQHDNVLDHSKSRRPDAQDHYLTRPAQARAGRHAQLLARMVMEEMQAASLAQRA